MTEQDNVCEFNNQQGVLNLNNAKQGETNEAFELENKDELSKIGDIAYESATIEMKKYSAIDCSPVKQHTVWISSACKSYGTKNDPIVVLDRLNMAVPKGIIYGLLGASGCGKTTLLGCILGLRKLNSGEISVLGRRLSSKGSDNLGSRVGYMPQEMALYGDFTIRETLTFFGWIAGMTNENIQARMEFLMNLLLLPKDNDRVKNLSGGQQRRVSLATALLHEPELLILDEPTVGLDSVLRESIWNHFSDITKEGRTTVLITTHYIDETRRAHCVALMRNGSFLAEDSPDRLLDQYGSETLEALFFKLSSSQSASANHKVIEGTAFTAHQDDRPSTSTVGINVCQEARRTDANFPPKSKTFRRRQNDSKCSDYLFYNRNHMTALLWKHLLWMLRNSPLMMAIIISPFLTISLFRTCIGNNPADIPVAVVNYETNNSMNCQDKLTCNNSQLSCSYLKYIQEHGITLIPYDTETAARNSVLKGKAIAYIVLKRNYSAALSKRVQNWQASTSWDILYSEIDVFRDVFYNFANYLKQLLSETLEDFLRDYMASCGSGSEAVTAPIRWESSIYGGKDSTFSDFVITGLLIVYICFLSAFVTVSVTMIERKEGLLERIIVSGVKRRELLTSHLICQFVIILIQSAMTLVCLFFIFNVTMEGSHLLVTLLTILCGCCGMFYGLCLSCACNTEQTASYVVTGTGFSLMVISGTLWPVDSMHPTFKKIVKVFPLTQALESMRSVILRGWGITTPAVYMGFITIAMWTIFFLILSVVLLKLKKL